MTANETLEELREKIGELSLQKKQIEVEISEAEKILEEKEIEEERLRTLQESVQIVASAIQQGALGQISRIVNKCLSSIFDNPYEFEILFERKRNKTEAHIIFKRDGHILDNPIDEGGGGAVDVASFALRIAAIVLSKPKKRKLLILDEPFKFVSSKYRKNISKLLEELSAGYGIQIIMITHIDELKTGTICKIS